ncbi:hypothetical protein [Amycolatopsis sp. NPDC054798]
MITFGVWPGVVSTDLVRLETFVDAPPEDVERTAEALRDFAKGTERFYVRCYRGYRGPHQPTPPDPVPYLGDGRVVDYVLGYSSPEADPDGFADAVRAAVREVAELGGGKLQVCEEVNVAAPLDGGSPGCYDALAAGLAAALDERTRLGVDVAIGFNAAVALPGDPFWAAVRSAVDPEVLAGVDFLGLDFFPDVFRPVPFGDLADAVTYVVRSFRESAAEIGIPDSVPIHITETGWPTGPENSEEQQVLVMESVARTVFGLADEVGLDTYEIFGLRDGLSSGPRENRFGLLRDDYSPKPVYATVKQLVAEYAS